MRGGVRTMARKGNTTEREKSKRVTAAPWVNSPQSVNGLVDGLKP
jgi:hypothetical protein